jgi:hypothetical protein
MVSLLLLKARNALELRASKCSWSSGLERATEKQLRR